MDKLEILNYIEVYLNMIHMEIEILETAGNIQDIITAYQAVIDIRENCANFEMAVRAYRDKLGEENV